MNIIYLALNKEQYAKEAIVSIKSLFHTQKDITPYQIFIYTNLKSSFTTFLNQESSANIHLREISDAKVKEWSGEDQYVYRAKISTLIDFIETDQESAILVDTDTFYTSDISPLFSKLKNKVFIMDYRENHIDEVVQSRKGDNKNRYAHRFFHDIYKAKKLSIGKEEYPILSDMTLWNSGVVGITHQDIDILYKALAISDYVYHHYRLQTAEQFAFTCAFQYYGQIENGDDAIFHYWFLKEARYLIESAYGILSEVEKKHLGTPIVEEIFRMKDINFNNLPARIVELTRKKWNLKFSSLLSVFLAPSNTGTLLKKQLYSWDEASSLPQLNKK